MAHGAGDQNYNTTVPKLKTILVGSIVVDSPLRKRGDTIPDRVDWRALPRLCRHGVCNLL